VVIDYTLGEIMHFVVKTREGLVRVGGPDARVEEFAAQNIIIRSLSSM